MALGAMLQYARAADPRWRFHGRGQFIVFAQGRSGSTLLTDLLNHHPEVVCRREILSDPVRFPMAFVTAARARMPRHTFGFKVKVYQLTDVHHVDPGTWLARAHRRGWKLVYLRRENLLRQLVSGALAAQTGRFHRRAGDLTEAPTITLEPGEMEHWLRVREQNVASERAALDGLPHVEVTYEALADEQTRHGELDRVFDHVGVERRQVDTGLVRIARGDLREQVVNYDEVAAALAGTPWERFLAE